LRLPLWHRFDTLPASALTDAAVTVAFGERECGVRSVSQPSSANNGTCVVTCFLPRAAPSTPTGGVTPTVNVDAFGDVRADGIALDSDLYLMSVTPAMGSIQGGGILELIGCDAWCRVASCAMYETRAPIPSP
jgi:hypothetical protein